MTDFIKEQVSPDDMITTTDVAEAVRFLLRTSPRLPRPGDRVPAARQEL